MSGIIGVQTTANVAAFTAAWTNFAATLGKLQLETPRQQRLLWQHGSLYVGTQQRPVFLLDGKVTPEIEDRVLANMTTDPHTSHQTVGEISLARGGVEGIVFFC